LGGEVIWVSEATSSHKRQKKKELRIQINGKLNDVSIVDKNK
jgi:hypothetical protein